MSMTMTSPRAISGRTWLVSLLLTVIAWSEVAGGIQAASTSFSDIVTVLERNKQKLPPPIAALENPVPDKDDFEIANTVEQVVDDGRPERLSSRSTGSSMTSSEQDATGRLILKLVDVAIEDALERGASRVQVRNLLRKRSGLRKCFFHAVNCW